MGRWGLLLFGVTAILLSTVTGGDDPEDSEKFSTDVFGPSKCDTDPTKVEELSSTLVKFSTCIGDAMAEDTKRLVCDQFPVVSKCFQEFLTSVSDCYVDETPNWNNTLQSIESVQKHLCKEDNKLIDEYYEHGGDSCLLHEDVINCGRTLSVLLLSPNETDYHISLLLVNNEDHRNITRINSCVVEKLKDEKICQVREAATIFMEVDKVIANTTRNDADKDGASEFSVSSTFLWILTISVTGLVILTPS